MCKKQQNIMVSIPFKNKNVENESKLKLQEQYKLKMRSKLFENIAAFSSIKAYPCSFIRSFSKTKIKAVDSFGEINSIQMENNKRKRKGYYSSTSLLSLRNKWLKSLKINAHIPNNVHPGRNATIRALESILSITSKKDNGLPITARILSPSKHGFNILTSFGFVGLIKKDYLDEIVRDMSYKILLTKKVTFFKIDTLAAFYSKLSFFVNLDEVRFIAPHTEMSHRYFIPKSAGIFKAYFKPVLVYKCPK